ncbi:hypothetical protein [Tenacibaculum soleae]|uniref:hypothetical protein n=1 Tax=Tenacibaculum soleae TaxID=447689 RepID=UPI0026E3F3E7|nr:hypothetical protein [Tenacibaculum soleae]MDO6813794.1 hypothetical protein [Tenacibaculum soleae]
MLKIDKTVKIVSVHFNVSVEDKLVKIPDNFNTENYPKRTQEALKKLKNIGYHLQTTITL